MLCIREVPEPTQNAPMKMYLSDAIDDLEPPLEVPHLRGEGWEAAAWCACDLLQAEHVRRRLAHLLQNHLQHARAWPVLGLRRA